MSIIKDLEKSFLAVNNKMLDKFFAEKLYVLGITDVNLAIEHVCSTCKSDKAVAFIKAEFDEFVDYTNRKEKFLAASRSSSFQEQKSL